MGTLDQGGPHHMGMGWTANRGSQRAPWSPKMPPLALDLGSWLIPWDPSLGLGFNWGPLDILKELLWMQEALMYIQKIKFCSSEDIQRSSIFASMFSRVMISSLGQSSTILPMRWHLDSLLMSFKFSLMMVENFWRTPFFLDWSAVQTVSGRLWTTMFSFLISLSKAELTAAYLWWLGSRLGLYFYQQWCHQPCVTFFCFVVVPGWSCFLVNSTI